ncbi:Sulfur oxidation protein SoxX [Thioalkalivibrio nitratireducens DSM 14787]|uniref:Sulfur oxidation protein SoxX n=1 Tax=Thioalkalivibrio nitratireducens (strain DSM 14787 / UNIQEM 213 / ALEN2) TaxID=1255043 RepID=L0DZN3_THIND|nr:sulfur oxidation c-type cytochrome SoxX [Thioalkalivibrio nitratireducens]AGA35054.1 Sulfur oxidation protein SoxX [Thioalkalivibrio nitratireducens DSM 14787]
MFKKTSLAAGVAAFATLFVAGGPAVADADQVDYTAMTPHELAEYLIFEANDGGGFNLSQEMQEGGTARDRMQQDELQEACSIIGDGKPDADTMNAIRAAAAESIVYPEGGIQLGDWERGRELAWSGFGYRVGHNYDDHTTREVGGTCYNCHQFAMDRTGGTVGPGLTGYGKTRGSGEAILKYAYDMIYNPHVYFPCTHMPRFGASGFLDEQAIADIMAYMFDPESPVNE